MGVYSGDSTAIEHIGKAHLGQGLTAILILTNNLKLTNPQRWIRRATALHRMEALCTYLNTFIANATVTMQQLINAKQNNVKGAK